MLLLINCFTLEVQNAQTCNRTSKSYTPEKTKGLWGSYLATNPRLSGVKVGFIVLPENMATHYLALEQYFVIKYDTLYNTLISVVLPGPVFNTEEERLAHIVRMRGQLTYVSLTDQVTLVHTFNSVKESARQLGNVTNNALLPLRGLGIKLKRPVKNLYFSKDASHCC
jgi:hypothetical protein